MSISFVSFNLQDQAKNAEKAKEKTDVAAIVADNAPKKKQESSKGDVAAVLAMSNQPPLQEGNRELCLA